GCDVSLLPLEIIADRECLVAHLARPRARAIETLPFSAAEVRGKAVLIHTEWARHWRTESYFEGFPYVTGRLAAWLRDAGAALVGIGSHTIDCTDDGERPVHSPLLRAAIPIVEHMRGLGELPERGARFFAVPAPIKGLGSFPVRAFAAVETEPQ